MKCPFELPVRKVIKRPYANPYIEDGKDREICMCQDELETAYIAQAINSHEKLVEALKENYEFTKYAGANKRINTPEYMDEFFNKGLSAQKIAKQALKEAEKP